eukprot:GILK01002853.1.p1 GENE.GILK01002853.1~~GILK01002853.1.p1  ORF type:complete len:338 (-),score=71.30 GILK01002853.1:86-1099(-)
MAVLTQQALKDLLKSNRNLYYTTAELNDKLFLHYKGYVRIENLEPFTGLKVLYLEGNGLSKIEGLDTLVGLRCLYLQENCIEKIENLDKLTELDSLNLSDNVITKIENLGALTKLNTLQIKRNKVGMNGIEDLRHLVDLPNLGVLDLSDNKIEDPEILPEVLEKMPCLSVLYLQGNPVIKKIPNYRKTLISRIAGLKYLDDRPVFEEDRRCALAFARGGLEAEREEKKAIQKEKEDKDRRNHEAFQEMLHKARQSQAGVDTPQDPSPVHEAASDDEEDVHTEPEHGEVEVQPYPEASAEIPETAETGKTAETTETGEETEGATEPAINQVDELDQLD